MKEINYKELVLLYYEELWNEGKLELVHTLFDEELTFRGSFGVQARGIEEYLEYIKAVLKGIPNLYHGVEMILCEKNLVSARAVYNGDHTGMLFELPPTNKRIQYNGASFFKFRDGKIIDIWVLGDLINLQKQLNVLDMKNGM